MVEQTASDCTAFRHGKLETHTYAAFPADQDFRVGEMTYDPDYLVPFDEENVNPLADHAVFEMTIEGAFPKGPSDHLTGQIKAGQMILSVWSKIFLKLIDSFADSAGDFGDDGPLGPRDIGKISFTGEKIAGYEKFTIEKQAPYIKSNPEYYAKTGPNGEINSIMICNLNNSAFPQYCSIVENEGDWEINVKINSSDLPKLQMALQTAHKFVRCLDQP